MLVLMIDMQIRSRQLSRLKQELIQLRDSPVHDLAVFLSNRPLVKGSVYPLRRKCFKPSCRCARGALHETVVLTASIEGKTRLWTIPEDRIPAVRLQTEAYRRFRRARAVYIQEATHRQEKMLRLIDAILQIRTQQQS